MISEAFNKLRSNLELNSTYTGLIQQHHNAVRSVMENNIGSADTKLIGSLQRKTRIQPKQDEHFDIDILVVLGTFCNWLPAGSPGGVTPFDAMQRTHEAVTESDRYAAMGPQQDQPTVSFTYENNIKVEFVPAYIDQIGRTPNGDVYAPVGRAFWIPKGNQWVLADYDHDATYITAQNDASNGYLVPIVKMLKAIKREHFPVMESFHLELIAAHLIPIIVAIRNARSLPVSYSILINDFFDCAKDMLATPIKAPDSHSAYCSLDSTSLAAVSNKFAAIQQYCINLVNKSETEQMKDWRVLFGEAFPTQI